MKRILNLFSKKAPKASPKVLNNDNYRDFKDSIIPPEIDLQNRFCARPFEHVEIMHGYGANQQDGFGDVYVCCSGWLSKKIGNYLEQDLKTIWNSAAAQDIRASILDGSFRYCNKQVCPYIQSNSLPELKNVSAKHRIFLEENETILSDLPSSFFLCYDRSCNLTCKSCRNGLILFSDGIGKENPIKLNEKLMTDLFSKPTDRLINIKITGSGDPFASPAFKEFLENLDGDKFPGLEIELFTNGLLFNPRNWEKLVHIHKNIKLVSVSIDAASAETYRHVRGGSWSQLQSNLEFIGSLRKQNAIRYFATNYVVQTRNFHEAADFVRMCEKFYVDTINFSFVSDWNTWTESEFQEQCIWKKSHPQFSKLIETLQDPIFNSKIAVLGPLEAYRRAGINSEL